MITGRVLTAMVTPFGPDLSLDLKRAQALAERLVRSGSDGLVLAGTTGESPTLTQGEKLSLFSAVLEAVGDRAVVIANTGTNDSVRSASFSRQAAATGVHGLMAVVPYYNKPSQAGMLAHFETISAATDLPLMVYNVPSRTASNLLPETAAELAVRCPNVTAVKEACGTVDQAAELCRLLPGRVAVYCGDDSLTLPLLAVGACGVVSVASHLVGARIQQMIEDFFSQRQAEATALHRQLLPLFRGLFAAPNPCPVKAALAMCGFAVGEGRLPLVALSAKEKEQLRSLLADLGLLPTA
ncbi:MAG: 4-hydroxy-tetrahydrodipicolinate synthase [Sulfobacillus sp.]